MTVLQPVQGLNATKHAINKFGIPELEGHFKKVIAKGYLLQYTEDLVSIAHAFTDSIMDIIINLAVSGEYVAKISSNYKHGHLE